MEPLIERIEMVLGAMAPGGPRNLRAYLAQPGPDLEKATEAEIDQMIDLLLSTDPNNAARLRFSNLLRSWDNSKDGKWISSTSRNTDARRKLIHERLQSDSVLERRIDDLLPFYPLEEPVIISEVHQEWYTPRPGVRDYYWSTYIDYLRKQRGWDEESILDMDNSTRAIVECLANPESPIAYASRGLVMGYVQSGKTANFTGVVARSADAGYRLIIVLAGTWNILRNQTQRRFDKELLGKQLLKNDETYTQNPPPDWAEFLEHDGDPTELGHYAWQRLTRPDIDFKRLKAAIDNLEFERKDKSAPIYASTNLHALPVKLLVVKKHPGILANLVKDLGLIRTRLTDIPTLIIDDESDQAGLNTIDPKKAAADKKRPPTNERIVQLLRLFPRGQYVGYTATPYANALVNPNDPEDLFPRDFIVSLDRARGYMGVSDFFDPASNYKDLDKDDFSQPEIAFIRRVENLHGEDNEDLKRALRSYLLAGGLKLYRNSVDSSRYKSSYFKHHTMLVHTSQLKGEHLSLVARLESLWGQCAFNSARGLADLENLWNEDYSKVSSADGKEIMPAHFSELIPYLSESIKRIEKGPSAILVVNSDSPSAPDFSEDSVWKIVVGGNKLSRGYTIEGLTVSYYRRVAGTADTLMQMGRWFGFRPGYRDLVRVFLGVEEGKKGDTDLVLLFKEVCLMEERFRNELKRYIRKLGTDRITPKDIPPLISISGSLPPTASNKMFNAVIASKNFGGQRSMLTRTAATATGMGFNIATLKNLLAASSHLGTISFGGTLKSTKNMETLAVVAEATNQNLITFIKDYRWLENEYTFPERPTDTGLQIEFLEQQKHEITSWIIIAPQRKVSFGKPLSISGLCELKVKERHRVKGRRFQVFGEPDHRTIAEFLAMIDPGKSELTEPNEITKKLRNKHRGVILLYPVRESPENEISIGFELVFPNNNLPFDMNFTVRRKNLKDNIFVQDIVYENLGSPNT